MSTEVDLERLVKRPGPAASTVVAAGLLVALLTFAIWSLIQVGFTVETFTESAGKVGPFLDRMLPLEFPPAAELLRSIGVTLGVVLCGTVLSAVLSVPIAYISARNTSPARWLVPVGRSIGVVARAVPDVVLAMLFVLLFSLGSLPGILAIALHSIGMISKLFADAIEQIDEGPRHAIRSTGASPAQEFWSGVFPQVLPSWIATTLHRGDINLRGSVLLGYAGIIGLGYDLRLALESLNYHLAMALALVIFGLCVLFEIASTVIRAQLLGVAPSGVSLGSRLARRLSPDTSHSAFENQGFEGRVDAAMRRPWTPDRIKSTASIILAAVVVVAAVIGSEAKWLDLFSFWSQIPFLLDRTWPPSIEPRTWTNVFDALLVTLQIAAAATLLSLAVSLLIGPLAARNAAPNKPVRLTARLLLLVIRSIPELILAIVLIIITGLGPQAGTLALAVVGVGLLGKLIADSLEEAPPGPQLAVHSVGGTRTQVFFSATARLSVPALVGHTLYLFDSNIRSATVLGIVAAGGIGYYLIDATRVSRYDQVTAFVIVLVTAVVVVEGISAVVRRALR
ncbi:phosphonate ABC transporter, permease protein PhnE [Dactylosporangium siamense]|uniref:Phosphate-import permease protein PhnE n=1 Tax=Dactylosporangium siamense TaxID=685454 RepID=A0A919PQS6_9ACTN|nr:phosphonate ABC transporter, permease protein PhnE [Dactylosporangium siamense]GIG46790.1 phosphate-import permease protein PhnE [Dactylosporangium siamense]